MIKKLIISLILIFLYFQNTNAFDTGTLLISNFWDINTQTICNANTKKCYFIKWGIFYNLNWVALSGQSSYSHNNIFIYWNYIYTLTSVWYITKIDTLTDILTYPSRPHPWTSSTSLTLATMINDELAMEWLWSGTRYYYTYNFSNGVSSYKWEWTIWKNALLSALWISLSDFIFDIWSFNYKIWIYWYSYYSNNFYKKNWITKINIFSWIPFTIRNYNYFYYNNFLYLSYTTTSTQWWSYYFSYKDTWFLENSFYFFWSGSILTKVTNNDYLNYMYTWSTAPVSIPKYNSTNWLYDINYIAKNTWLYTTSYWEWIENTGGGNNKTSGNTWSWGSTTTKQKDEQLCVSKTFTGVLSGTGTNEIVYNLLSTGSQAGALYSNGNAIIQSQLWDRDLLNIFNDNQITFTGSIIDNATLTDTFITYRANNLLWYPKTIDVYIWEPINSNYSISDFYNFILRWEDGKTYSVPNFTGSYWNKYTIKISDTIKISSFAFQIKWVNGKIPSLQKIRFYWENTSETKTRYECSYNDKLCGWDTYYSAQKKSYCIETGDFNYIKDEYIWDTETTESFFDFSPIIDGFNSIKDSLTGTGTGTGGTIASGSGSFWTGTITFSSGAGNFTPLAGVGTGVDCSNMFVNWVFQYSYWNKTNFMTFVGWDLFSKLWFQRWEVKILWVNLVGWVYDLLNVTCSSISNLLLYAFNLLFNNFDFIYYLFNEPVRGQDYCYFWIKLKVYAVWETNHFWTTNKRQFDYFVTIFIMLSLLYLIIRK